MGFALLLGVGFALLAIKDRFPALGEDRFFLALGLGCCAADLGLRLALRDVSLWDCKRGARVCLLPLWLLGLILVVIGSVRSL